MIVCVIVAFAAYASIHSYRVIITTKTYCPFCLHQDDSTAFLIRITAEQGLAYIDKTTRDIRRKARHAPKMGRCPECLRNMRLSSLLTPDSTFESYAVFILDYPSFFKSIDFEKWSKTLQSYGWSNEFWSAYQREKANRGILNPA